MGPDRGVASISHHLFLEAEEGRVLAAGGSVEAVGWHVRVDVLDGETDEPAGEVLCLYRLEGGEGPAGVAESPGGFEVRMGGPEGWRPVMDREDGGSGYLRAVMGGEIGGMPACHVLVVKAASQNGLAGGGHG